MKAKTHSGAKKRLHLTKTGKIISKKCGRRHLQQDKSSSSKRTDIYGHAISQADARRINKAFAV